MRHGRLFVLLAVSLLCCSRMPVWGQTAVEDKPAAGAGSAAATTTAARSNGSADQPEQDGEDAQLTDLKKQSALLSAQADVRGKELDAELADLKAENERLKTEAQVAKQRQQNELLKLELEKQALEVQAAVEKARLDRQRAAMAEETAQLTAQMQLNDARQKQELATAKAELEKLQVSRQLDQARQAAALADLETQRAQAAAQNALLLEQVKAAQAQQQLAVAANAAQLAQDQAQLQLRDARTLKRAELDAPPQRRAEPFVDGKLYLSDRTIKLDGPIITGTADYVCSRIDFFNNESSTDPIFLVIDNSPGGSVMQGYRIVKAIEASPAPVHVVVRSFAASMAAVITTLAPHSYVYRNAIMLHHQMSAGAYGNMTDLEQQVQTLREWERRLADPVAKKMGLSLEEFKKRMYSSKSSGDWDEFGDRAVELRWADHVVDEIRDEGQLTRPTGSAPKPWWYGFLAADDKGHPVFKLPPLEPADAYFLYNPNQFYRMD